MIENDRHLFWWFLFIITALVLSIALALPLRAETQQTLQVTVVYDPDGDGQAEGVPYGTIVYINKDNSIEEQYGYTGNSTAGDSVALFNVTPGTWTIESYPKSTRLFFVWVCRTRTVVQIFNDYVFLPCEEKFFIRIPFIND